MDPRGKAWLSGEQTGGVGVEGPLLQSVPQGVTLF
jgi:hypothetical protein